ncbi:MAG: hypothetical protein Rubg2KO_24190 [Rubricoccaceae bacterium]
MGEKPVRYPIHNRLLAMQNPISRLLLVVVVLVLAACDTTTGTSDAEAPTLIPEAAFAFDADLGDTSSSRSASGDAGLNFFTGAARVGIVSLVVKANLILPAAMTSAATSVDPIVTDGVWVWSSTRPINGTDATFRLEGAPDGSFIDWNLRVTTANPATGDALDDFVLYTARTSLDGQTGTWRLYYRIDGERTEVLSAEYDVSGDVEELLFTVENENDDHVGSTVLYQTEDDTNTFDWLQKPQDIRTFVQWDDVTGAGFIEADDYKEGVRSCWDASGDDVACQST